ncbi:MAG: SulP family inorganic anion transporter [Desulfobulbaceae bacterium]|nr:SulP family inorganic anion transporter [Desulfobulbaceae bacterium]HIJ90909.1 SulP family inorganic anion transporter [Deltaproteobacteria bacterium]
MLQKLCPFLPWFREYDKEKFKADAVAGITVALVLIPQSMAYAQLAGLPAYYGLYASFLPPVVAALFGSSRQLATGPVAVVSLMTAASLESIATAGSEEFIAYAIMLALTVGFFQFFLGVFRLGLVVNLLSHPVVTGFTNAAAIIIATAQLSKIFGIEVDKGGYHYETMLLVLQTATQYIHWPTFGMAALAMAIMVGLKKISPKAPAILVAVVITTLLSWFTGFERHRTVTLADFRSPEFQGLVKEFNREVEKIQEYGAQRSAASGAITGARNRSAGDAVSLLEIEHAKAVHGLMLSEAKERMQTSRTALRAMQFVALETPGGVVLYKKGELPREMQGEGRTWRLKVGNAPLPENRLVLNGGGAVLGNIPQGLPSLGFPEFNLSVFLQLFSYAAIISLLGFMEAISIAKAIAAKTGQKLDANQELMGQGLANIIGSLSGSYPVSGSFSRSAVNLQAGGKTGLANVYSAIVVIATLLFLTPLLYHLPQAVLAVVIMMAVIGLVQVKGFVHAWKAQRADGVIAVTCFCVTLGFAPHLDKGILLGVFLSVAVFLYRRMYPNVSTLAMRHDGVLGCVIDHGLQVCSHIAVVRFDGTLFFANASYLDEQVFRIRAANPELKFILLAADGINDIDASGEEALSLLVDRVRRAGVGFAMCRVKGDVMAVIERTGLADKIGREMIFAGEEMALRKIIALTHGMTKRKACGICPLMTHLPVSAGQRVDGGSDFVPTTTVVKKMFAHRSDSLAKLPKKIVAALAASA